MAALVADTSGVVSLGIAAGEDPDPLAICLDCYDVLAPDPVLDELRDVASYDDEHGAAASAVLDRDDRIGLVHASLSAARLVTTPTLLAVLVRRGKLDGAGA